MEQPTTIILRRAKPSALEAVSAPAQPLRIYVPSVTRDGVPLRSEHVDQWTREVESLVCEVAGGCTTIPGHGSWADESGRVHREPVRIVTAAVSSPLSPDQEAAVYDLCYTMALALFQACVAFEYAGRLGFVDNPSAGIGPA